MPLVHDRHREILHLIWQSGPLSRSELHERTGVRPNTIGADVDALVQRGILTEGDARRRGPGRPRVPVSIDHERLNVLGLAFRPGEVSLAEMNLLGHAIGPAQVRKTVGSESLVHTAAELLQQRNSRENIFAIGLSTAGFVDQARHELLFSSATTDHAGLSLEPIYKAAGDRTIVLGNDMHALAAHWLLKQSKDLSEDVLIIGIDDGQMGGAMLIDGKPNRGCVSAANEFGHTRLTVETDACYCGQVGCMERICSTPFVERIDPRKLTMMVRAHEFDGGDKGIARMIELLSIGISNAINMTRVHRLVIVSELAGMPCFIDTLQTQIRARLLVELSQRVGFELWNLSPFHFAETAGWLALAGIYCRGWDPAGGQ